MHVDHPHHVSAGDEEVPQTCGLLVSLLDELERKRKKTKDKNKK
jgi:hypothetical protein